MWGIPNNVNPFSGQLRPQETTPAAILPQANNPGFNWGTVNPYSGQMSPAPANWSNYPQQVQKYSDNYLTPLSRDIGTIWQNYGQGVSDYYTKPSANPLNVLPVRSSLMDTAYASTVLDPSRPITESISAIATSPFRKTPYASMPEAQRFPIELAAGFVIPTPGGKSSAVSKAEQMMAKGYKAGHSLESMAPIISKATGLTEDAIRTLSNTLGVSEGQRAMGQIKTASQKGNKIALREARATLKDSPLRPIAVQASTEGTVAVEQGAPSKYVRSRTAAGQAAEREALVAQEAAGANPYIDAPKYKPTTSAPSGTMPKALWLERLITDVNAVANRLGSEVFSTPAFKGIKGANPVETMMALYKGASLKGLQLARDAMKGVDDALDGVSRDRLDDFLRIKHNLTIFEMNPNRGRVLHTRPNGEVVSLNKMGLEVELQRLQSALGDKFANVEQAGQVITSHYNSLMNRLAQAGRIDQRVADTLVERYPWYNPIGYIDNIETVMLDPTNAPNFVKTLSDVAPQKITKRPLEMLATETIKREKMIQKNCIINAIAEGAANSPSYKAMKDSGANMVPLDYWKNGVKYSVDAPEYLLETVANFFAVKDNPVWLKLISIIQDVSRAGMTRYNPAFYVPNLVVDTFTAMATQGVSPVKTLKYLGNNLRYLGRDNPAMAEMMRVGAAGANISAKEVEKEVARGNIVLDTRKGFAKAVHILDSLNEAFEMAPRMASYETALERGFTTDQAALFARRVTIDFSRGGQAVQAVNTVFLFLNAAVQGAMVMPRAAKAAPAKFAVFSAGCATSLVGLYAYNSQYKEYYDVPEYIRKGSILVMLPSDEVDKNGRTVPHYIRIIPNLREFSIFQSVTVQAGDMIKGEDPQGFAEFAAQTLALTNPFGSLIETGPEGSPYISMPTQALGTAINVGMNYDPFRQQKVVTDYMKESSQGQRSQEYNQYTSMLARRIGELSTVLPGANQVSPRVVDYVIQNIGGGGAQTIVSIYDAVDKLVSGLKSADPRVAQLTMQLKGIQVNEDPQFVVSEREKLLNSLDPDTRRQVLILENTPEMKIPIVSNIIGRFYNTYGGRQMEIATKKAQSVVQKNVSPSQSFVKDTTSLVAQLKDGEISKQKFDQELSKLKAFKSGASAQKYAGSIYSSEANKFMPGGLPEPQKALDDYFTQLDQQIASYGGAPSSDDWDKINQSLDKYLTDNYSARAVQYVKDNKLAWIKDLPSDVQDLLKARAISMDNGSWFNRYSDNRSNVSPQKANYRGANSLKPVLKFIPQK